MALVRTKPASQELTRLVAWKWAQQNNKSTPSNTIEAGGLPPQRGWRPQPIAKLCAPCTHLAPLDAEHGLFTASCGKIEKNLLPRRRRPGPS